MKTPFVSSFMAIAIAMTVAGCSPSTTAKIQAEATGEPFDTSPVAWLAPLDYERALLEDYFSAREAAFEESTDAGVAFLVEHNVAGLGAHQEACKNRWFGENPQEHVREIISPKWDTLRRDPTWTMKVGPRAGQVMGDDIFVMVVEQELIGDHFLAASQQTKMHFQVMGNGVRNFVLCEPIKTIDIVTPGQDPQLEDIPNIPTQEYPTYSPYPPGGVPQYPTQPQLPPQLPPVQPPVQQPIRPSAPIVLPPIQATGRPVVRPTPQKPSQSPTPTPSQSPSPSPSVRPSTPTPIQPKPSPTPSSIPSAKPSASPSVAPSSPSNPKPTAKPTGENKPLPQAPEPPSSAGSEG